MLVLSRRVGEEIIIAGNIRITVAAITMVCVVNCCVFSQVCTIGNST